MHGRTRISSTPPLPTVLRVRVFRMRLASGVALLGAFGCGVHAFAPLRLGSPLRHRVLQPRTAFDAAGDDVASPPPTTVELSPPLQAVSDAARKAILTEYDNDKNQAESNDYSQFSNWADAAGESVAVIAAIAANVKHPPTRLPTNSSTRPPAHPPTSREGPDASCRRSTARHLL